MAVSRSGTARFSLRSGRAKLAAWRFARTIVERKLKRALPKKDRECYKFRITSTMKRLQ